jgi:tetratricopeptide (TPR) repeat protein
VRKFASKARRNTDDQPLLEFHAPRQLFSDTRDLNIDLLYEAKDSLLPRGTEISNPENAYYAMIEPFLHFKRSNLANQSMGLLAQAPRKEDASLQLAIAKLKLDSGDFDPAGDALREADALIKPESPLFAEKEELWGILNDSLGETESEKQHFEVAAKADPSRPLPLRKLGEMAAKDQSWIEAATWAEQFVATRPPSLGHYWAVLGDYRLAADQRDDGIRALEMALEIDPYVYWGHYRMARVFDQKKDMENATKEYEYLVRYAFDRDPDIYIKLATIYRDAGRKRDALRVLAKGVRILSTNPAIYRLYREVLEGS